jgi:hypothetical protein
MQSIQAYLIYTLENIDSIQDGIKVANEKIGGKNDNEDKEDTEMAFVTIFSLTYDIPSNIAQFKILCNYD